MGKKEAAVYAALLEQARLAALWDHESGEPAPTASELLQRVVDRLPSGIMPKWGVSLPPTLQADISAAYQEALR